MKKNKKENEQEKRRAELLKELQDVRNAIDTIYANLSYVVEPELIDCCIYELNAFQLRYKFILNQVKEEEDSVKIS